VRCRASHATSFSMNPGALDGKVIELTKFRFKQSLDIARLLGAEVLVFHSGYNAHIKSESYRNQFVRKQVAFWKDFIKENDVEDLTIVLENTFEEDPHILKAVYDAVDSNNFKACLDLGHVSVFSNYNVLYWFKILKKHLKHFHVHNNNSKRDQHNSILRGEINFTEFFEEITRFNQPFTLTLEIFEKNDVIESLEFIRKNFQL
ncbi:MAG: sugar phosphate isomerase/epimerase family protein, partial [Vampirovibrionia bacterium]